jgi:hypothetical protein
MESVYFELDFDCGSADLLRRTCEIILQRELHVRLEMLLRCILLINY